MMHKGKNFEHLIGHLKCFSEKQLRAHFQLYEGYVKKLAEIEQKLDAIDPAEGNYSYSELSELQRRHSVAYNGVYLHELFFGNLTNQATRPSRGLKEAIMEEFGSMETWIAHTQAGLKTANGWVLLCRSRIDGTVCNNVIEEHHRGVFVEQDIILAIDGWEHAFMIDYGVDEAGYFKSILPALDWNVASRRFEASRSGVSLITAA